MVTAASSARLKWTNVEQAGNGEAAHVQQKLPELTQEHVINFRSSVPLHTA